MSILSNTSMDNKGANSNGHLVDMTLGSTNSKVLRLHIDGRVTDPYSTHIEFSINPNTMVVRSAIKSNGTRPYLRELGWFKDMEKFEQICLDQPVPRGSWGSKAMSTMLNWFNFVLTLAPLGIKRSVPVPANPDDIFESWVADVQATITAHHDTLWQRNNGT